MDDPGEYLQKTVMMLAPLPFHAVRLIEVPSVFTSKPHWHWRGTILDYFNLWICLEGRGTLHLSTGSHEISPGTAFVLFPGDTVDATHDRNHPIRNFAAHFLTLGGTVPAAFRGMRLAMKDPEPLTESCRFAVRCGQGSDPLSAQQAAAQVFMLLLVLWRELQNPTPEEPDDRVGEAIQQLSEQPSEWLSVRALARKAGMSESQFSRRFVRHTGETPGRYAARQRMLRAQILLRDTPLRVGEIAEELGYRDIYYFSRQFRRHAGLSPLQWRARHA